jgi:hypothetical protein
MPIELKFEMGNLGVFRVSSKLSKAELEKAQNQNNALNATN